MTCIAIVCGAGIMSGKEVIALELGQGLRDGGTDVHFLTSRWGSGEFGRRTEAVGFQTNRLWLGFISATLRIDCIWMTVVQFWRWPSLLGAYRRFLWSVKPAKVIQTNWHHALLLWPLLKAEREVYWLHEVIPNTTRYRRIFGILNNRIGSFVAVSQAAGTSLIKLGVPEKKVRVIYNGISDPSLEHPQAHENSQTIGIVGQVGPWKGHGDLIDAFRKVVREYPEAQLCIFGKGSAAYESSLRKRVADFALEGKVVWRGFVADRNAIYGELSLLVVPSRSEDPLPTTAIEAAFFGIPVIASRRGGLVEIVEDGVTGFLFEAGKFDELARHVVSLLGSTELRTRMGRNARKRAMTQFSRDRFVRQFCEILELK